MKDENLKYFKSIELQKIIIEKRIEKESELKCNEVSEEDISDA